MNASEDAQVESEELFVIATVAPIIGVEDIGKQTKPESDEIMLKLTLILHNS